jgi:hypothetical protein
VIHLSAVRHNFAAFLTEDHVRELRQLRVAGSSYSQLAERFGIDKKHAWRICQRIAWSMAGLGVPSGRSSRGADLNAAGRSATA